MNSETERNSNPNKGESELIFARINAKGQITLPQKIRQVLAVRPGDKVWFDLEGDKVILHTLEPGRAKALAGSLRDYVRTEDPGSVRAQVKTTRRPLGDHK